MIDSYILLKLLQDRGQKRSTMINGTLISRNATPRRSDFIKHAYIKQQKHYNLFLLSLRSEERHPKFNSLSHKCPKSYSVKNWQVVPFYSFKILLYITKIHSAFLLYLKAYLGDDTLVI